MSWEAYEGLKQAWWRCEVSQPASDMMLLCMTKKGKDHRVAFRQKAETQIKAISSDTVDASMILMMMENLLIC